LCVDNDVYYEITARGWLRIGELSKSKNEINQGFIAMAFKPETAEIGEAFRDAIAECGYIPRRIDQKEHNNQIVPEIFYEIKRSKFLVVDVTIPNYGAYYEAGYGEALNKQVIVCCKQNVFNNGEKPHFDIAQKSTVVWKDIEDLKQKLKIRIEATVGLNRKSK
jgi:nucleoside 2-deoxyribosyltransferase